MPGRLCYELPTDPDTVAYIVRAIPSGWKWIDGGLIAPRKLYEQGQIAENTRLSLSRFYSIHPTIIGAHDVPYEDQHALQRSKMIVPKIDDVTLRRKFFSSVFFHEAGFETKEVTMDTLKELIEGLLRLGYKGSIHAFSGYRNNHKYDNPERFSFTHASTKGGTFINPSPLPPHLSLAWHEEHDGKREHLDDLVHTIERVGLQELHPQEAR